MAYFIFSKNLDNITGTLSRIAENEYDYNNLNITPDVYKIIQVNLTDFNNVKYGSKFVIKYNNNEIFYENQLITFQEKINLQDYIEIQKKIIKQFTDNNANHALLTRWNNYYTQLSNLNLDNITFPLNKSLEQYFNDLGQPSFHILQIP